MFFWDWMWILMVCGLTLVKISILISFPCSILFLVLSLNCLFLLPLTFLTGLLLSDHLMIRLQLWHVHSLVCLAILLCLDQRFLLLVGFFSKVIVCLCVQLNSMFFLHDFVIGSIRSLYLGRYFLWKFVSPPKIPISFFFLLYTTPIHRQIYAES